MTLGEKIKEARKNHGLSQEQFAEKLCVSRSAVAKWETDKGTPDIENLKAISSLLNVSIDYLLDDGEKEITEVVTKESYDIKSYGKGIKKAKKDKVMLEKFPDAKIYGLLGELKRKRSVKIIDFLVGFFTWAPFDSSKLFNILQNADKEFYLVERNETQFLVLVTDEFIETKKLLKPIDSDKFEIGNWTFLKCGKEVGYVRKGKKQEKI